jgi:hypothetical protein
VNKYLSKALVFIKAHKLATACVAAFLLGLWAGAASAADATLTWTAPTTRTDGSPLTNLAGYRIKYGTVVGTYPTVVPVPNPAATSHVVTGLTGGQTYYFVMTAYDVNALESANTNPVSRTFAVSPPNPPGGLTVTALIAYNSVKQRDKYVLVAVGTVPANTACDVTQTVNGHYVVPRAAVTWFGSVRPEVVVAQCG